MAAQDKLEDEDYEKIKEDLEYETAGQNAGIYVFNHITSQYRSRNFDIPKDLLMDWACGSEIDPNYNSFKKKIDTNRRLHREELVVELSKNEMIEKEIKKVLEQYHSQQTRKAAMQKKRKMYDKNLEEIIYELNFVYNNIIHCFIDRMTGYLGKEWRDYDKHIAVSYQADTQVEHRILEPYTSVTNKRDRTEERIHHQFTSSIYPELLTDELKTTYGMINTSDLKPQAHMSSLKK